MKKAMQWCASGAQYYLKALKNYAVFQGRARRREFWFFQLYSAIGQIFMAGIGASLDIHIYGGG